MKITLLSTQYTFTPSLNQVSFANMAGAFKPECLLAVINTTTGKLVYAAASQPSGYGGTFSTTTYPNDTLTYASSNAGQSASDILEILFDDQFFTQPVSGTVAVSGDVNGDSYTHDANGVKILSTPDPITGNDGLNVHELSSAYGGQIGSPMPLPYNNNALSIGVNNGGDLYAPAIDISTSELQVQAKISDSAGLAINNGQQLMADSVPVAIASDQSAVPVSFPSSTVLNVDVVQSVSQDILGVAVGGNRNNQIEISFNTAPGASLITNSFTGSGNQVQTSGHTLYRTGSTAVSSAQGRSVQLTTYRPAHEIYACFTAAFINPTGFASSKIGLFDNSNGFFIGYDGVDFGVAVRNGAADTYTYQASFNTDTLTGASTSKFTRNGVPEAVNFALSNLYRIRFAWLGSANIYFEIFSPDGEWVLFHNIRQPNTSLNPSIQDPNLPMTVNVSKTAGATDTQVATACWGAGTTSAYSPITATLTDNTLAALNRSVITGVTTGGGGGYVNVKVNPSGALTTETTISGTVNVNEPDLYFTGAVNTAVGNNLFNAVAGPTATDASGYKSGAVQVFITVAGGTLLFQHSSDGTTWETMPVFRADSASPNAIVAAFGAAVGNFIYHFPIKMR